MKRVLLDENIPRTLTRDLQEFEVRTVQEEGWSGLTNGALLRSASASFDVLVTGDRRLQHQQNIAAAGIAVVVVAARSTRVADIRALLEPSRAPFKKPSPAPSPKWPRPNLRFQPTQPAPAFSRVRYHFVCGLRG